MKKGKKLLNGSNEDSVGKIQSEDPDLDVQGLRKRLIEEDAFLKKLVDTIPAKMYFDRDIQETIASEKHLAMDKAVEELKRKSSSNHELSIKNKHKRARLDPSFQKSVSQIHQELGQQQHKRNNKNPVSQSVSFTRAANIEELQRRLQDRIKELQAKRKVHADADSLEKKRLKTKVKKLKAKKKGNLVKSSVQEKNECTRPKKTVVKANSKPVYNKEGKIIYSKFDFSDTGTEEKKKSEFSGKKYKKMLHKAEKEKEKIDYLKGADNERAEVLAQKSVWKRAILKSEGIKVKDDPTLLKKSLKNQEKVKQKRSKMWKERVQQTEKRMQAGQQKRSKNIKARKKAKLDHKIKRAKKKGRVIPGF